MNVRVVVVAALLLLLGGGCRMAVSWDWVSSVEAVPAGAPETSAED